MEANQKVIIYLPAMRLSNNQTLWYREKKWGKPTKQQLATKRENSYCHYFNTHWKPKFFLTRDVQKGHGNTEGGNKKKKAWEDF